MPNQDIIDRKGAWIERMFDRLFIAIKENTTGAILVVSVFFNIWQFNIGASKDQRWQDDITKLNDKINLAVEKSVQREIPKQLAPIIAKADSSSKSIDTSLLNIDGAVETFKQYIHKTSRKAPK